MCALMMVQVAAGCVRTTDSATIESTGPESRYEPSPNEFDDALQSVMLRYVTLHYFVLGRELTVTLPLALLSSSS